MTVIAQRARGPQKSLLFWGKGGMTERYGKSPAEAVLFEWSGVHSDVVGIAGFEPAE